MTARLRKTPGNQPAPLQCAQSSPATSWETNSHGRATGGHRYWIIDALRSASPDVCAPLGARRRPAPPGASDRPVRRDRVSCELDLRIAPGAAAARELPCRPVQLAHRCPDGWYVDLPQRANESPEDPDQDGQRVPNVATSPGKPLDGLVIALATTYQLWLADDDRHLVVLVGLGFPLLQAVITLKTAKRLSQYMRGPRAVGAACSRPIPRAGYIRGGEYLLSPGRGISGRTDASGYRRWGGEYR